MPISFLPMSQICNVCNTNQMTRYKVSDEIHTGAVPADDMHLVFNARANSKYVVQLFLYANNGSGAGRRLAFKWRVPDSSNGYHYGCGAADGEGSPLKAGNVQHSLDTALFYNEAASANAKNQLIIGFMFIETGNVAGTVCLQWAGDDPSTTDFKIYQGSVMLIRNI